MHKDLSSITQFILITERIGTAGQPSPAQFAAIKEAGYQVVINLALPTSTNALPDEGARVAQHGMTYIHIPVVWEAPKLEDFDRFLAVMKAFENQRVFVHCALNMRVSSFIYLYRILMMSAKPETAALELHKIWQPDEIWQRFIDQVLTHYAASSNAEQKP